MIIVMKNDEYVDSHGYGEGTHIKIMILLPHFTNHYIYYFYHPQFNFKIMLNGQKLSGQNGIF